MTQAKAGAARRRSASLRAMVEAATGDLDLRLSSEEIAKRASYGRFHLDHRVKRDLGESPTALRRRLLLERAAFRLLSGTTRVTAAAHEAHYASLEAFTRAFRRAFGICPSKFRRSGRDFRLSAPNGVHYEPPARDGGAVRPARRPTGLSDRMVRHNNWLGERLFDAAALIADGRLDRPVRLNPPTPAFGKSSPSIREMLDRLVLAKEMWVASISGRDLLLPTDMSLQGMRARLVAAGEAFAALVREISERGAWDTAYLDAVSDPPETTTFGAAVSHLLAWDAVRREIIAGALRAHGVETVTLDPISWERGATDRPRADDGVRLPDRPDRGGGSRPQRSCPG